MSTDVAPTNWAYADQGWAKTLGLPPRPEGWGLIMFTDGEHRWTWAGDRVVVAALEEHKGGVPNWEAKFTLEADGWPVSVPSLKGPQAMTWRPRIDEE